MYVTLLVILLGLLMVILNIATYRRVEKYSKYISSRISAIDPKKATKIVKMERKFGIMFGINTITFLIMYFSMGLMRLIFPNASITHTTGSIICYLIAGSIVVIDPLVYIIFQKNCRNEVIKMFNPMYTSLMSIHKNSQNKIRLNTK